MKFIRYVRFLFTDTYKSKDTFSVLFYYLETALLSEVVHQPVPMKYSTTPRMIYPPFDNDPCAHIKDRKGMQLEYLYP